MFQDIEIENYKYRTLSRPLTPEMTQLTAQQPDLFSPERGGICFRSPKNFIGAQITALSRAENIADVRKAGLVIPSQIDNPIRILEAVPLTNYDDKNKTYQVTNQSAERVLFKNICGLEVGVVISGSLAGLILRTQTGIKPEDSLCINRVFNDSLVIVKEEPELPLFSLSNSDIPVTKKLAAWFRGPILNRLSPEDLVFNVRERFSDKYKSEIAAFQQTASQPIFHTDLFFNLCEKLGLSVDKANFHFTRFKPGMEHQERLRYF